MASYLEKEMLGFSYLKRFQQYAAGTTYIDTDYFGTELEDTIVRMRTTIKANVPQTPDVQMGQWWFDNMTLYINILKVGIFIWVQIR